MATNRKNTAIQWAKNNLNATEKDASSNPDTDNSYDRNDANVLKAKLMRHAKVVVYYDEATVEDTSETNPEGGTNTVTIHNDTPSNEGLSGKTTEETAQDELAKKEGEAKESNNTYSRYDNEARFFERITKESPIMSKLLTDKIKYFNPAFHSVSPEGFNARITFLEQCMRQGPTVSGSDTRGINANNLSFGRQPICVLRLGDFYNTKIVINTLSKRFDPLVWDLNHEGIGVMPMICTVTLGFTFIGGSDLGGPIQRLQNAISFNYYANTSVYDNRAEEIEYDDSTPGEVKNFKTFNGHP